MNLLVFVFLLFLVGCSCNKNNVWICSIFDALMVNTLCSNHCVSITCDGINTPILQVFTPIDFSYSKNEDEALVIPYIGMDQETIHNLQIFRKNSTQTTSKLENCVAILDYVELPFLLL